MNNEQDKLFYTKEEYEYAIKDAGNFNFWFGCGIGAVCVFILCLTIGWLST